MDTQPIDFDWNAYAFDFAALELVCESALVAPEDVARLFALTEVS